MDEQEQGQSTAAANCERNAANAARIVKAREREWSEATTPEEIVAAEKRLARARARHKTAVADAERHAGPASETPLSPSEARLLAAWLTAQWRKSLTGEPAVVRVVRRASLAEGATESIDYLEFAGGTTPHYLTVSCTSKARALAHWDGYAVAPSTYETPAEHNRFKGSY